MIIEQVEALKTWLTSKLSPICDAEPSALAKYVCALVKKDKSEDDLRDICLDQLDVFLQLKTKSFVDELFETLKTKSYIPSGEEKKAPAAPPVRQEGKRPLSQSKELKDEPPKKKIAEVSSSGDKENVAVKDPKEKENSAEGLNKDVKDVSSREVKESKDIHRDGKDLRPQSKEGKDRDVERIDRRDSWKEERNKEGRGEGGIRDARDIIREREGGRDTREVREPRDRDVRDREYRRRRTRSRSFSPRRNYATSDDRIRRRYDDRYNRYSPPDRRWGRRRSWSRSPRRIRSPIGRPRSRSPRPKSRSPRLRSRSPRDRFRTVRSRTRSRSRSPRARSWSRLESGTGLGRPGSPLDSRGSTPIQDADYSTLISSSTNELPSVSSTVGGPPLATRRGRTHCVDFEEKGFCVMGDMCPFDHGADPVVVEDIPIGNVIPGQGPPPGVGPMHGAGFMPPEMRLPPPGHMGLGMDIRRLPPPNMVEPYMPEAPGLRGPLPQVFQRGMPPNLRPPPPGMMFNRPSMQRMMGPPQREVVLQPPPGVDDDDLDPLIGEKEPSRIVIPAKHVYPAPPDQGVVMPPQGAPPMAGPPPPNVVPHINQHHHIFGQQAQPQRMTFPPQAGVPPRRPFDYNRLGRGGQRQMGNRAPFKTGNLTLEVRKIPAELNNIAKLNEHFGKFGVLTNIQVKFQGDASAALITFSNNGEATSAYKSPEPVFNNRFIKLFWHNPAQADNGKDGSIQQDSQGGVMRAGGKVGDGIDHPSLVLPARSTIPPAHKLSLDNTKNNQNPADNSASVEQADQSSIVYTSSVGNLKKTVFNAGAAPTNKPKPSVAVAQVTSKPSDFVSRIEAIKRAEENKKIATVKQVELEQKKQELLAKQIQQQKILIETLEKRKGSMSEQEKSSMLKSLKVLSDAIDKVKYSNPTAKKPTFQTPTPSQMKFVSPDQQAQSAAQAPTFSYGRGRGWAGNQHGSWHVRGRGRGAASAIGRTTLDNRPKTIEVKDFDLEELEEVKMHFQRFGEFDKVELVESMPSIFITFMLRQSAEMAVAHGKKFKTKMLTVRWNQMMQKVRTDSVQSSELDDDDLSVTLGSIEEEALRNISASQAAHSATPTTGTAIQASAAQTTTIQATSTNPPLTETSSTPSTGQAKPSVAVSAYKQRTLSEDLLMGDEHNFRASYTDDEEDDHITVTLATTGTDTTLSVAGVGSANLNQGLEGQADADLNYDLDSLAHVEGEFTADELEEA